MLIGIGAFPEKESVTPLLEWEFHSGGYDKNWERNWDKETIIKTPDFSNLNSIYK